MLNYTKLYHLEVVVRVRSWNEKSNVALTA